MNTQEAKQIKITDYLNSEGIRPTKVQGNDYWYCSPLRQETTPSFKVNNRLNVWYDHGLGQGGNILDLVIRLFRLNSVSEALEKLSNNTPSHPTESFSFQQQKESSGIIVSKITPVSNPALIAYIKSRHINIETAERYCKDVYYTVGGKHYFSVGFGNDGGGYELSNPYFKGSISPKGITTIRQSEETSLVFEGFWDFLSFLTLKGIKEPQHDVAVLNSVANLQKALNFITSHKKVYTYLDNDEAGRQATQTLKSACENLSDQSKNYVRHKDLNEFLCSRSVPKQVVKKKPGRGLKM